MRLLRMSVSGVSLYRDDTLELNLFASDRVPRVDGEPIADVTQVDGTTSIFSQNVVGISGVNASGKTVTLGLVRLVLDLLAGDVSMRGFGGQRLTLGKTGEVIRVSATFSHDGSLYLVESRLRKSGRNVLSHGTLASTFSFEDETLWRLNAKRPNRRMVADESAFGASAEVVRTRHGDAGDPAALTDAELALLGPHRSIVSAVTGRIRATVATPLRELPARTLAAPVVQAFDPNVERLEWDEENEVYILKFRGERERVVDRNVARALLSRGTVYGVELVEQATDVLSCGGYLLVDEMEEAINRSLVATVIDLFASPVTNPRGAQLVFTTHYPELLDVLHRKDCVYLLVRGEDARAEAVRYSDRVGRIENKKSEVVLSDLIRGTMPRYPDVRAMREYVRGRVNG